MGVFACTSLCLNGEGIKAMNKEELRETRKQMMAQMEQRLQEMHPKEEDRMFYYHSSEGRIVLSHTLFWVMTQEERWMKRYNEVVSFIETNHRNPSRHRIEEHDILNWLKANRKEDECREIET